MGSKKQENLESLFSVDSSQRGYLCMLYISLHNLNSIKVFALLRPLSPHYRDSKLPTDQPQGIGSLK